MRMYDLKVNEVLNTIEIFAGTSMITQLTLSDLDTISHISHDRLIELSYKRYVKKGDLTYNFIILNNQYTININCLTYAIKKLSNIEPPMIVNGQCKLCQQFSNENVHINCVKKQNVYDLFYETDLGYILEQKIIDLSINKYLEVHVQYENMNDKLLIKCFDEITRIEMFISLGKKEYSIFDFEQTFLNYKLIVKQHVVFKCLNIIKNGGRY